MQKKDVLRINNPYKTKFYVQLTNAKKLNDCARDS